jgi:hypothetical protein
MTELRVGIIMNGQLTQLPRPRIASRRRPVTPRAPATVFG